MRALPFLYTCCLAVLLGLLAGPVSAAALSNVLVSKTNGKVTIETRFSCSFRYDGQELAGTARKVEIELVPVGQCPRLDSNEPITEMRRPSGSEFAGLSQIEVTGRANRIRLTVHFKSPQRYTVSQSGGLRSVRIIVESADVAAAAIAAPPPTVPLPKPTAQRRPRSRQPSMTRVTTTNTDAGPGGGAFVINLLTVQGATPVPSSAINIEGKQLYVSTINMAGAEWQQLRIGFFTSEGRAEAALASLQQDYADALIVRVDAAEFQVAAANPATVNREPAQAVLPTPAVQVSASGLSDERLAELMSDARNEMLAENYSAAIRMYTKVLREGDTPYAPDALEYLGLARERNGQEAHAVAEYRRYLAKYSDNTDTTRVQQRLDGLLLSGAPQSELLAPAPVQARNEEGGRTWEAYGGISQYYRRDVIDTDDLGSETIQSAVLSDVDVITRSQGERFDFGTRMTFGNYYDLLSDDEGVGDDTRLYYLYADVADREHGISARLGRQTLHTSGVLGRFDGAHLAWQFSPDWRVNFMAGEPIFSTSDDNELDRSFYSVSIDAFDLAGLFDASIFYNTQDVDGIDSREAVGGELRYYDDRRSLISMVDYDLSYNVVNSFVALGNLMFEDGLTLSATYDFRRSPYLLTENALIGQGVGTIDELLELFSEDEVRELAEDRSGELTTITLGLSSPLYERFQVNADVTMSDYSGTDESINIEETPGLGNEYYYNVSVVGSSLIKEGDTSIMSLRYQDGNVTSTTSMSIDTRYPVTQNFRINPRLLVSYRDFSDRDSKETLLVPALRLFYQFRKRTRLEFELGARWSDLDTDEGSVKTNSWFLYTGYRTDF